MTRPASVTTAVVVLSLFALAIVYWLFVMYSQGAYLQFVIFGTFLLVFLFPIYGLITRKAWSRIYSIFIFILFAILILVGNGTMYFRQGIAVALFYGAVIAGLLFWLVASLSRQHVKTYFSP